VLLERELNARAASGDGAAAREFEVLNLGIPHLGSGQIRALLEAEGLSFAPDVVLFYEGMNDTRRIDPSLAQRLLFQAARRLVIGQLVQTLGAPLLERFSPEQAREAAAGKRAPFVANVARMREACERRGVRFIAVTQQAQSNTIPREEITRVTYAQEVGIVRARLAAGESLDLKELQLLIHADLMDGLREWAAREDAALVDGIAALDEAGRRDTLVSYVHLDAEGNRILAGRIADALLAGRPAR
jgi:lysophospholipase L1-like esterase